MSEPAGMSPKALEEDILNLLQSFSPTPLETARNPRVEFYDRCQHDADERVRDFLNKYGEDLNTTLIFAGLFSAIAATFIIDAQDRLQPNPANLGHVLLTIIGDASLGKMPIVTDGVFPQWNDPDPSIVRVHCILYSSLGASLFAALMAMLGKQWLSRYAWTDMRGSVVDRSRRRQRKMKGMDSWHFNLVMESLPLMLQIALLLFGYALSDYLLFINKAVASVVMGFVAFGLLVYILIAFAATLSYNCPFQTPPSLIIHSLVRLDNQHKRYLKRTRKWFSHVFSKKMWRCLGLACGCFVSPSIQKNDPPGHIELPMAGEPDEPCPLFNEETDWDGYVLDSDCIAWMFEMSTDMDAIMAILRFIPEVVWHAGIRTTPLEKLYDMVLECFDDSAGHPVVIPKLRNKAYYTAKALLHLAIQRQCFGDESDTTIFESISNRHLVMGSRRFQGDSDLESTFGVIDRVLGNFEPMCWQSFSFTPSHHAWMGHILLYRAWDALGKGEPLPDDIKGFVLRSLRLEPPPSAPVVVDCLLIVGLVLGIGLHVGDLSVVDKSHKCSAQTSRIYKRLTETFQNTRSTVEEIDRALEAMELIAPLCEADIAEKSYHLFQVVMQAPNSLAYSQEKKWEASRLAMHAAYKWDMFSPSVEDPRDVITFLKYHFDLATREGQNQDGPIQNALRALANPSGPTSTETLRRFDPTEPSFVRGIRYVYQDERPLQLRKAALFFLPLIGDRLFHTPHPIMEAGEMKSFCEDWASAVDGTEYTNDVQKATLAVLFGMINSPHWRPHIVPKKWELLRDLTSVPDDFLPLSSCIENPDLIKAIGDLDNPMAIVLWTANLWLRYGELVPSVRLQLEEVTTEMVQNQGGSFPDESQSRIAEYLSITTSELKKAEEALGQYPGWSGGPATAALTKKVKNLRQAVRALDTIKQSKS